MSAVAYRNSELYRYGANYQFGVHLAPANYNNRWPTEHQGHEL